VLILWILLALGAAAAFYFAREAGGDSARALRVLGVLLLIAAVVVFVIWLVGVLDNNTNVDTGMVFGGGVLALLRRLRAWVWDELWALIYDTRGLRSSRAADPTVAAVPLGVGYVPSAGEGLPTYWKG
jgi:hypothetical protein